MARGIDRRTMILGESNPSPDKLYQTVTSERLYEAVVRQIEALIAAERLSAGDVIPSERRLAELFGVSRSVVREAMRALERAGLIAIKPGRGAFVQNPSSETISRPLSFLMRMRRGTVQDCVEFRFHLEPQIAYLAAERRSDADVEALRLFLKQMNESAHQPRRFIEYDQAFHSTLAESTGNPIFLLVLDSTFNLIHETRVRTMHISGDFRRDRFEHSQIFERVRARDAEGAKAAMKAHLRSVVEQLELVESLEIGTGSDAGKL